MAAWNALLICSCCLISYLLISWISSSHLACSSSHLICSSACSSSHLIYSSSLSMHLCQLALLHECRKSLQSYIVGTFATTSWFCFIQALLVATDVAKEPVHWAELVDPNSFNFYFPKRLNGYQLAKKHLAWSSDENCPYGTEAMNTIILQATHACPKDIVDNSVKDKKIIWKFGIGLVFKELYIMSELEVEWNDRLTHWSWSQGPNLSCWYIHKNIMSQNDNSIHISLLIWERRNVYPK